MQSHLVCLSIYLIFFIRLQYILISVNECKEQQTFNVVFDFDPVSLFFRSFPADVYPNLEMLRDLPWFLRLISLSTLPSNVLWFDQPERS